MVEAEEQSRLPPHKRPHSEVGDEDDDGTWCAPVVNERWTSRARATC